MTATSLEQLETELEETRAERNKLHAQLTDFRLTALEKEVGDHETRLRPLEGIANKFTTLYALFAGNGLLSIIALIKLFSQ